MGDPAQAEPDEKAGRPRPRSRRLHALPPAGQQKVLQSGELVVHVTTSPDALVDDRLPIYRQRINDRT
jgi:hypothetical protein